jgi:PAS domain S-box-containing protein
MQLAAAAAGIGFLSRDLASKTEEWDDQMLHIYGVRREDFDGVWEPHVHPDDLAEVQRLTRQAIRTGAAGQYQYRIVRPDGEVRHLRGLSTAIRDAKGHAVSEIGVNFDITEQKQAEAALAAARQREKETEKQQRLLLESKLKTSLTASAIAHEINQPLSRILLISELVLGGTPGLNRQCKKLAPLLKELGTEASRVVATIGKMKSLLRNVETRHHRINLVDVAEDALLYSKPLFKRHRVQVSFEPPTRACRIAGDAEQIQIALNNLLRNAVEALAAQRTRRPRKIAVEIRNQRGATHIVIGDSGPGLTEKESRRLLLQSTKPEGSGLGLFLAATAAENHGGRLEIDHSHLGGAEFRLIFPKKL